MTVWTRQLILPRNCTKTYSESPAACGCKSSLSVYAYATDTDVDGSAPIETSIS
jgi:hypothetical protein